MYCWSIFRFELPYVQATTPTSSVPSSCPTPRIKRYLECLPRHPHPAASTLAPCPLFSVFFPSFYKFMYLFLRSRSCIFQFCKSLNHFLCKHHLWHGRLADWVTVHSQPILQSPHWLPAYMPTITVLLYLCLKIMKINRAFWKYK